MGTARDQVAAFGTLSLALGTWWLLGRRGRFRCGSHTNLGRLPNRPIDPRPTKNPTNTGWPVCVRV